MFSKSENTLASASGVAALALSLTSCTLPKKPAADLGHLESPQGTSIGHLENFNSVRQIGTRDCVPAMIEAVIGYLNPLPPGHSHKITQKEIRNRISQSDFDDLMYGDYTSVDAMRRYFNEVLTEEHRGRYHVRFYEASNIEEIRNKVQAGNLVVVAFMLDVMTPVSADVTNGLLMFCPQPLAKAITGGESFVFSDYLHVGVLVGGYHSELGEFIYVIAEPWRGQWLIGSPPSPGFREISEAELKERMFNYDQTVHNLFARRYYDMKVKPDFEEMAPPGSYAVFEKY